MEKTSAVARGAVEAVRAVGLPALAPSAPRCRRASACRGSRPIGRQDTGARGMHPRGTAVVRPSRWPTCCACTTPRPGGPRAALREPGQGVDLPVRPDRLRPAAPRPRAGDARVRRARRYLEWTRARGAARLQHHRHRRQDHRPGQRARAGRGRTSPTKCEAVWFDGDGRHRRRPPDDIPHATEYVDEMVAMIGELVDDRTRPTSPTTACTSSVETVAGLRAARPPVARRHARRRRRPRGVRRRAQAPPGRLRAVEAGQAGRAVVAVAVGRRPARLAQRVRRDEPRPARRGLRPPLRRAWTCASRTTRTSGPRPSRSGKRFANHWMHHGFVVDAEGEKMSKSLGNFDNLLDLLEQYDAAGLPDAAAAEPLPQPGHASAPTACEAAEQAARRPRRVRRRATSPASSGRRRIAAVLDAFRARDGRRPRHAGGDGRCCSTRCGGPTPRSTPATRRRGAARRPRSARSPAPSGSSSARPAEVPADVRRRPPRSTPRAPRRTSPGPTPSAPSCRPTAGSSRPTGTGRGYAADSVAWNRGKLRVGRHSRFDRLVT